MSLLYQSRILIKAVMYFTIQSIR